jgi:hypothetical protein
MASANGVGLAVDRSPAAPTSPDLPALPADVASQLIGGKTSINVASSVPFHGVVARCAQEHGVSVGEFARRALVLLIESEFAETRPDLVEAAINCNAAIKSRAPMQRRRRV